MFNLFPKKKTVDEILKDADIIKSWVWKPTQTPSMLQAQNDLIEQFLKENHDLKVENQKLKNDWHQPELFDEKISELTKEVIQLRHLKQENVDLIEMLAKYRDGYQGSCYACEPVGELNQKLELQVKALHKIIDGAKETIDKLNKELYDVKMENNSLKIFPIEDKGDVRLQKHPMYPLHWGGYDGVCSQYPKEYSKWLNEQKNKSNSDIPKTFPNEFVPTWEEAASDLALRVVKLERKIEELRLINTSLFLNKNNDK
jgi:regulator of replication initiation timing